jgi:hypothetical protein
MEIKSNGMGKSVSLDIDRRRAYTNEAGSTFIADP